MSIHGKLKQTRFKIFDQFRSLKTTGLLVCTDVMARGIDIAGIDWVFQFDAPSSASDFVHRCGRTARIGNRGTALALLLPNEEPYVHFIDINQKVLPWEKTLLFLFPSLPICFKLLLARCITNNDASFDVLLNLQLCLYFFRCLQVKLYPMELPPDLPDNLNEIRQMQQNDRALMDKATRAFVSYIHSYVKHECSVLLRVKGTRRGAALPPHLHRPWPTTHACIDFVASIVLDLDFGRLAVGFGLLTLPRMPELKNRKTDFFQPVDIDLNAIAYK